MQRHPRPRKYTIPSFRVMTNSPLVLLATALLAGCSSTLTASAPTDISTPCFDPSRVDTSLFEGVDDPPLQAQAIRAPDRGGARCASTFRLKPGRRAASSRVFGGSAWRYGPWWAIGPTGADSSAYRAAYGICPAWNGLDSLLSCPLAEGARFAIGPGQRARCNDSISYGTSDSLQVFFAHPQTDLDTSRCVASRAPWR